ncbi:L,D-transpeptidase family protein [Paenibacillus spiritus]|uniref:L,D-transpeptidase family protein n=1 Tax=Paenibacillus spiritus TaxID=2496557 RepID=UPI00168B00A6|nr:L,D-transpeptidase family protein [Paenibacillus spiritus]
MNQQATETRLPENRSGKRAGRNRSCGASGLSLRGIAGRLALALLVLAGLFGQAEWPQASAASAAGSSRDLIIVNKTTNRLAWFSGGEEIRTFPVATGRTKALTPEGSFPIVSKIKNRPYYKDHIAGGDPKNPLGDRWLGLQVNDTYGTTYAIHGNNNESSIGKHVSAGCIRMHNDDIRWLYPKIAKGTRVVIVSSEQSMKALAVKAGYKLDRQSVAGSFQIGASRIGADRPFVIAGGRVFVPLRETAEAAGAVIGRKDSGALTVTRGGRTAAHLPLGSTVAADGRNYGLPASSFYEDGVLMVPLAALPALLGGDAAWNSASKTAVLKL